MTGMFEKCDVCQDRLVDFFLGFDILSPEGITVRTPEPLQERIQLPTASRRLYPNRMEVYSVLQTQNSLVPVAGSPQRVPPCGYSGTSPFHLCHAAICREIRIDNLPYFQFKDYMDSQGLYSISSRQETLG